MSETLEQKNALLAYADAVDYDEWFYKDCMVSSKARLDPIAKLTLVVISGLRYRIILKDEDIEFTSRILTDLNTQEKKRGNSNTWLDGLEILCSTLSPEEIIDSVTESMRKKCKKCESTNLVKCGLTKFKKQRWLCRGCGRKQAI